MSQFLLSVLLLLSLSGVLYAQTPTSSPRPAQQQTKPDRQPIAFDLNEYGVQFEADPRLIVVMAALEVAGLDTVPTGREPSAFRSKVRKDLANLDPDLRQRLRNFYERNRLAAPATAADQTSRYVSLALALGPPPGLEAPIRSEDLPAGLLEVLDFASLVQEFYRRSGIDEQLVSYTRAYQAEGDRLRAPTAEMVRSILSYLHTRPITVTNERVEVKNTDNKKSDSKVKRYTLHQKDRRFRVMPDLLAAPGAINFRVIGDDYYAIVPEGTEPGSSELIRAYLQYVIDALVLRFNKEIADRREQVKLLLDERQKAGAEVSPDVFLSVTRSLVAAADARYNEQRRLEILAIDVRSRLQAAKDDATRAAITRTTQAQVAEIKDETVARLADEYEKGAVLSFFFADQLKGVETSGFDIANFFPDMIASFDPAREAKRPAEYAEARQRAVAARAARAAARKAGADLDNSAANVRDAGLVKELTTVEQTLRNKDYTDAETKLKSMLASYPREPRIFFALGQTASLAAMDATDETIRDERLNRALGHYRLAVQSASPETDKAVLSRAHESMGRINAFLDNKVEAAKEFDEAIKLGEVTGGAYKEALEGKKKLAQPE
ncbi:MAG TPA: hypothetical protein VFH91_05295 [Pyrinomonadaceae bacterium]|nr:hypothetical protein [Pyrinomonadaceae bacterium]